MLQLLAGGEPERFGMGSAVVLGQDLAEVAGMVRHSAVADLERVTGSWVTVTGKRREGEVLITSMMPGGAYDAPRYVRRISSGTDQSLRSLTRRDAWQA